MYALYEAIDSDLSRIVKLHPVIAQQNDPIFSTPLSDIAAVGAVGAPLMI
jgi:hypothetical protein